MPILLLIFLGNRIRAKGFVSEETIEDLKKIVVNLALPAVLFLSFIRIKLEPSYIFLSVVIFSLCLFLLFLGKIYQIVAGTRHVYSCFMISGFVYGMLGVSLFGSVYGLENLGYIAIVDLGHELFVWFVLLPLLPAKRDGASEPLMLVKTFSNNPSLYERWPGCRKGIREYNSCITDCHYNCHLFHLRYSVPSNLTDL